MRTVYLNGAYLPEDQANISVFDRGFMFADSIYEVTAVLDGKLVDYQRHRGRLRRSLAALGLPFGLDDAQLLQVHRDLIQRNQLGEGLVYLQVSRGAADRNFLFPAAGTPPTVVLYTQAKAIIDSPLAQRGLVLISLPDLRWGRSDIKTTQLLYACMAKEQARAQGADDAWLVRDGCVTEGSSNNAFIVTANGSVVTRPLSTALLPGTTRDALLALVQAEGLRLEERAFTVEEALAASEAFISSSSSFIYPVVRLDGQPIGHGTPGPLAQRLRALYIEHAYASLG
ncbi:D-amino-acid transaminase [Pseudomonas typographi]|uniref:branched-chain-amino-acid transaminase n=1 Tax=Pseudomonas typographi TaxID=2715964 RepID=A0ABR7Z065_9PSED|nr:D-amino-acid transaminase [Pseudomonas typographi]MBD1551376.1 D-amino-acid transaminase [Pseudomonas typographi]MBD1586429.1 D-amino-acid transaminase [Pseudomonas typographi]MBD1598858.1 D-amino-acid transaminase [Pseudomonas typographi]